MFCREHAAQVRDRYSEITAKGADVVAIGTGNPGFANHFIEQEDIPFLVLIDDEATAAKAVEVRRGSANDLLGVKNWGGALRATVRGHRQRRTGRRPDQLGATFVVDTGGEVLFEHRATVAADNPDLGAVVASLPAG